MVNCPLCKVPMREMLKEDVLIDVCPQCRGVWLDRGEMEKLIASSKEAVRDYDELYRHYEHDRNLYDKHRDQDHGQHHYKKKKKHGVLRIFDELFD